MPPKVYVVRHAQGHHNVKNRHHLRDPHLTDLGRTQCTNLSNTFPKDAKIDVIMASPLTRTIETACLGFGDILRERPEVKFVLVPMAQEIANQPCDVGFEPEELKKNVAEWLEEEKMGFGVERMDWSLVHEGWNSKSGSYTASLDAVNSRAATLRSYLFTRPEQTIILVSHGAFLHYFSEDWTFFDGSKGTAYENCEFREFDWAEGSTEQEAHLMQVGGAKVKMGRPAGVHAHVLEGIEKIEGLNSRKIKVGPN